MVFAVITWALAGYTGSVIPMPKPEPGPWPFKRKIIGVGAGIVGGFAFYLLTSAGGPIAETDLVVSSIWAFTVSVLAVDLLITRRPE